MGIPSRFRTNLEDYASYQRLLRQYEGQVLPHVSDEISELARLMEERPAVLVCMEKDVCCCHRSRLAEAISRESGLAVRHL